MPPRRNPASSNGTAGPKTKKSKVEPVDDESLSDDDVAPKSKKGRAKKETKGKKGNDNVTTSNSTSLASTSSLREMNFDMDAKTPTGKPWNLKIVSWNINGIRAWIQKDGLEYLRREDPDIFCVNETKCSTEKMPPTASFDGYTNFWLSGDSEGYSGVGIYTKIKPINVTYGIGMDEHDREGRVITAEYEYFYVVAVYVPNAGRKLVRLDYRKQWDIDFRSYLVKLDSKKPVILCGDLNVAHQEIDLANPKTNKKNAGFTQEERDGFGELLDTGFVDSFRHFHPDDTGAYTFWTYMMNARAKNVGWRLDYFAISKALLPNLCESVIRKDVLGSDHCPIVLFMAF